jgi:hypothetical protein
MKKIKKFNEDVYYGSPEKSNHEKEQERIEHIQKLIDQFMDEQVGSDIGSGFLKFGDDEIVLSVKLSKREKSALSDGKKDMFREDMREMAKEFIDLLAENGYNEYEISSVSPSYVTFMKKTNEENMFDKIEHIDKIWKEDIGRIKSEGGIILYGTSDEHKLCYTNKDGHFSHIIKNDKKVSKEIAQKNNLDMKDLTNEKILKFEKFNQINENMDTVTIEIFSVPYELKKVVSENYIPNSYRMDNIFGDDGIEILKRRNPYGDPQGDYHNYFSVEIEDDTIVISLYEKILEDGRSIEEALEDALRTIVEKYESVGWEFLESPLPF